MKWPGVGPEGQPIKKGFSAEEIEAVLAGKGKLPLNELLRCRVGYLVDRAILGSRAFVDEAVARHRDHFSAKRQTGARPMRGGEWQGLTVARALQRTVFGAPAPA